VRGRGEKEKSIYSFPLRRGGGKRRGRKEKDHSPKYPYLDITKERGIEESRPKQGIIEKRDEGPTLTIILLAYTQRTEGGECKEEEGKNECSRVRTQEKREEGRDTGHILGKGEGRKGKKGGKLSPSLHLGGEKKIEEKASNIKLIPEEKGERQ